MRRIFLIILFSLSFSQSLFISEYSEGSSYNKYVEIYNPNSSSVDLSGYQLWKISNGGDWAEGEGNGLDLSGSLGSNDVFIVCHSSIDEELSSLCDVLSGTQTVNFNGDDAVGLAYNGELIDQIGDEGADPGSGWSVAGTSDGTKDHTLVRKSSIMEGNTDWESSAGSSSSDSEWEVYPQNTWTFLGWHIEGGDDIITGCTDPNATNYNSDATLDDGSCEYESVDYSISEIQGQGDASPYVGQIVSTSGVVTGVAYSGFFAQDGSSEWSGIWVYGMSDNLMLGDLVDITGTVAEYNDLTEIDAMSVSIVSSNNELPNPIILNTGDVGESYEAVLVSVNGTSMTEPSQYGEWNLDDGSGAVLIDDKLYPEGDDLIDVGSDYIITGPVDFTYGAFKVQPRSEADIILYVEEGVPVADAGEDQTIDFGETVVLDGAASYDTDGTILGYSWVQESGPSVDVDNYEQAVISFAAPNEFCELQFSLQVFDNEFNFSSLDYITITVGTLGIYDIQYTGDPGEYCYETDVQGSQVTVEGIVTHVKPGGQFFLQDFDYDLWSGIYVYDTSTQPSVGDELSVSATVNEYYSLTQLIDVTSSALLSSGNDVSATLVEAADIPIFCTLSGEMYESMFVEIRNVTFASVDEYGNWMISDEAGDTTMVDDYYFSPDEASFPTISVGDQYSCLKGIVSYSYNEFKIYPRNIDDFSCDDIECLAGDVNGDFQIDVLDVVATVNFILGNAESVDCADMNGDGTVDVLDIVALVNIILN